MPKKTILTLKLFSQAIWYPNVTSCCSINACLQTIAKDYRPVKFCRIQVKPYTGHIMLRDLLTQKCVRFLN
jgi:hypothetical protein